MSMWISPDGSRVGVAGACCNSCANGAPCDGSSAGLKPQVDAHMLGASPFNHSAAVIGPNTPWWGSSEHPLHVHTLGQTMTEHHRYGVGDAAAFAKAQTDLASMGVPAAQGDWAYSTGDYVSAITLYKQAGNTGAVTVGPEIDAAGAPQVTQQYTQTAWQINDSQLGPLQPVSDQQIAQTAQQAVRSMLQNYQTAITAGLAALAQPGPGPQPPAPPGPKPPPSPNPPPTQTAQKDYTVPILVGAGVVGAGIIGWALYGRKKR